ncbi:hypothetical protein [Microbacterium esteraromaticum]|uniref:hypothetical protein n=1 Tax=Microbacterium esteraromaticum TaxID=57043 RepID=UPI0015F6D4FB|nr:hypothetical protein [Microbacterium esteraromaticum]
MTTDDRKRDLIDDGRIRIWVNSGEKMSRGKYAAAAVHAALTAAGVHPGVPVIVLGGQRDHIERMSTVIRDAGRTEVEPGTATAGTDYVFEAAHAPTDDEQAWAEYRDAAPENNTPDQRRAFFAALRRPVSPEPSEEDLNAEYDARLGDGDSDDYPDAEGLAALRAAAEEGKNR